MKKILYILLFLPLIIFGQEQDPCYSINNFITQQNIINPPISYQLSGGWNMVGYTGTAENSGIANQINSALSNDSSIESTFQIIKNVSGQFWSSNFAQLLSFTQGEGYMMYVISETATSLSFNNPINIPEIIGCTDCEAINFNQWANLDDGSCNYDSDGDGVLDFDEVVGCQEANACNFDALATDEGECTYAEEGFDCEGNLLIYVGAEAQGGIVFYYDSIGDYGLIAAKNDINGIYAYGCYNMDVLGADGEGLGTGLQNSLNIVNQGCTLYNGVLTAAQAALDYEVENYSDWYLPSKDELNEMYYAIGNGGSSDNLGNFLNGNNPYISSTSNNLDESWIIWFADGVFNLVDNLNQYKVRPIRAFGNWIEGCIDVTACNFNSEANMADGSCTYPEQGYDCDGNITAEIGDIMEGGYLFYLDESGTRGLVAAIEADNISMNWFDALDASENYTSEEYNDWYLPSLEELNAMYNSIGNGGFQGNIGLFQTTWFPDYWSSSESEDVNSAWKVDFSDGTISYYPKVGNCYFRPIRAFGNWTMGCMDETACNYNTEANMSDGSCEYAELSYDCDGNFTEYIVGMEAEGGIVFYVDETGQHGLVAATEDLEGTYEWGCYGTDVNGANETAIGSGYQNTIDIVNQGCQTIIENGGITAAQATLDYESEGYDDWYLPSQYELLEIYNTIGNGGAQGNIGGFQIGYRWSSSEFNISDVWLVGFTDGYMNNGGNKTNFYLIIPIRSF